MLIQPDFNLPKETHTVASFQSKAAFEELYRSYWRPLYDYAYVKTQDGNVAEEIIQDLFVTLWEKRHTLHIQHLQSYLFGAVRNRVIDYYRRKPFSELESVSDLATPDYPLFLDELENAIAQAVAQLPPKTREIFLLNRFDNKTAREIARELGLPQRTVEYHITQALRFLKPLLAILN